MTGKYTVEIHDGDRTYGCETPDKEAAVGFISWFLSAVKGTAEVNITYLQHEDVMLFPPDTEPYGPDTQPASHRRD